MINKDVLSKTKNKLIRINIIVVSSFLILLCAFVYFYFNNSIYKKVDNGLIKELDYIILQLNNTNMLEPLKVMDPKDMIYVYKDGYLIYFTQKRGYFNSIVPNYNPQNENSFFTYKENGFNFREYYYTSGRYAIRVIRNVDSELNSKRELLSVMLIAIIISCILTYFIALFLTKKALKPIEITWNNQAKFIQDASHELRTPITIISSKLEGMLKNPNNTINDELESIADAMNESRTLKKMINDLLTLTKEDYSNLIQEEEFDLEAFINDLCDDFFDIALIQNKTLKLSVALENKMILADKNKIRQLLIIFIDNAFKYTTSGNYVKISMLEKSSNVHIKIEDNGIGIKKEDISHLFDRFFRSENVRNKDIDGSGIGLSIAKAICDNLKYKLIVDSEYGKWTKFEVIIPRKD